MADDENGDGVMSTDPNELIERAEDVEEDVAPRGDEHERDEDEDSPTDASAND